MIEIIPAIDLIDGHCVRLSKGDYASKKIYSEDPVTIAKQFEAAGLRRLHLVDLDGARKGSIVNLKTLEQIAAQTGLRIDFSGGIKTAADASSVFAAGAAMIGVGSMAVRQPEVFLEWIGTFGAERILLGADVRGEQLAVQGWQEQTDISIFGFLDSYYDKGIRQVFCTEISTDGMLQGPATDLYRQLLERFPGLHLIASGGVSSLADIDALEAIGCAGVIIGKALYEGHIPLSSLAPYTTAS